MKPPRFLAHLLLATGGLLSLTVMTTCSFVVDVDKLGNGQCGDGSKLCDGTCVGFTLAKYGCAQSGCIPCSLGHATAICVAGKCAVAACNGTNKDCNGMSSDGCEIDTDHDPDHCGACDATPCVVLNATPDCTAGRCVVRSCNSGYGDCDTDPTNGCETNVLTSVAHCGKCGMPCAAGKTCQNGVCN
jgi:hypothetical protein